MGFLSGKKILITGLASNLSKKQKDLLAEFGSTLNEGGNTHAPQEKSFLDKVKKFFDNL